MTAPEDQNGLREALARDYVLVKRGLYYRPNSMGYTGVLDDAGRYTAEEARFHSDHCDGVRGILASEAPRFSQACWPEIVTRTLTNDLRAAEAELDEERQESARLAHLAVVLECERNAHHKALKLAMQFVDCAAGEGLSFDADGDRPAMDAADVCFAVAEALGIEDLDSDAYRALVACSALATLSPKEHPHG